MLKEYGLKCVSCGQPFSFPFSLHQHEFYVNLGVCNFCGANMAVVQKSNSTDIELIGLKKSVMEAIDDRGREIYMYEKVFQLASLSEFDRKLLMRWIEREKGPKSKKIPKEPITADEVIEFAILLEKSESLKLP